MAERPSPQPAAPSAVPALMPLGKHAGKPSMPMGRLFTMVGSRHRAHLHLLSTSVSKAHAVIINDQGNLYIRDTASREHVIINGKPVKEADLRHGDKIKIGSFSFQLLDGPGKSGKGSPRRATEAAVEVESGTLPTLFEGRTLVIGRRPTCDIVLSALAVSNVHAIIFEHGGQHYIRDLGSRTGTHVNGEQIHQHALAFGDQIRIGDQELQFIPATASEPIDELEHLIGTASLGDETHELAREDAARSLAPVEEGPAAHEADIIPLAEPEEEVPFLRIAAATTGKRPAAAPPKPPALAPVEDLAFLELDSEPNLPELGDTQAIEDDSASQEPPTLSPVVVDDLEEEVGIEAEERHALMGGNLHEHPAPTAQEDVYEALEPLPIEEQVEEHASAQASEMDDLGLEWLAEEAHEAPVEVPQPAAIAPEPEPAPVPQEQRDEQLAMAEAIAEEYPLIPDEVPLFDLDELNNLAPAAAEATPEPPSLPEIAATVESAPAVELEPSFAAASNPDAFTSSEPSPEQLAESEPFTAAELADLFEEPAPIAEIPTSTEFSLDAPVPPPFPAGMHHAAAEGALGLPRFVEAPPASSPEQSDDAAALAVAPQVIEATEPTPQSAQDLAAEIEPTLVEGHDLHAESCLPVDALSDSHFDQAVHDFAGSALGSLVEPLDSSITSVEAPTEAFEEQASQPEPTPDASAVTDSPAPEPIEIVDELPAETLEAAPISEPEISAPIHEEPPALGEIENFAPADDTAEFPAPQFTEAEHDFFVETPELTSSSEPDAAVLHEEVIAPTEPEFLPAEHEAIEAAFPLSEEAAAESPVPMQELPPISEPEPVAAMHEESTASTEPQAHASEEETIESALRQVEETVAELPAAVPQEAPISEPEPVTATQEEIPAATEPDAIVAESTTTEAAFPLFEEAVAESPANTPEIAPISEPEPVAAIHEEPWASGEVEFFEETVSETSEPAAEQFAESAADLSSLETSETPAIEGEPIAAASAEVSAPAEIENIAAAPETVEPIIAHLPEAEAAGDTSPPAIATEQLETAEPWAISHTQATEQWEPGTVASAAPESLPEVEEHLHEGVFPEPDHDELVDQALAFLEHEGIPAEPELVAPPAEPASAEVPQEQWAAEETGEPAFQGVPAATDDFGLEFASAAPEEELPAIEPAEAAEAPAAPPVDLFAPEDYGDNAPAAEVEQPQDELQAPVTELAATAGEGLMPDDEFEAQLSAPTHSASLPLDPEQSHAASATVPEEETWPATDEVVESESTIENAPIEDALFEAEPQQQESAEGETPLLEDSAPILDEPIAPPPPRPAPRVNPMMGMSRDFGSFLGGAPLAMPTAPVRRVAKPSLFADTPVVELLRQNPASAPLLTSAAVARPQQPSAPIAAPAPRPVAAPPAPAAPPPPVSADESAELWVEDAEPLELEQTPEDELSPEPPPLEEPLEALEALETVETIDEVAPVEPTDELESFESLETIEPEAAIETADSTDIVEPILPEEHAETAAPEEILEAPEPPESIEQSALAEAAVPEPVAIEPVAPIEPVSATPPAEEEEAPKLFDAAPEALDAMTQSLAPISDITEAVGEAPTKPAPPASLFALGKIQPAKAPPRKGADTAPALDADVVEKPRSAAPPPPARSTSRRGANSPAPINSLLQSVGTGNPSVDVFSQLPSDQDPVFGAPQIPPGGFIPPTATPRRNRPPGVRPPPGPRRPAEPVPAQRKAAMRKPAVAESLREEEFDTVQDMDAASPLEGETKETADRADGSKKTKKRWRFPFFGASLLVLGAGALMAGAWYALPAKSGLRASLRFDALAKLSGGNRDAFVQGQQALISSDDFRRRAQQIYESDFHGHAGEGFLYHTDDATNSLASIADHTHSDGDRIMLEQRESRDVAGDRARMRAIVSALYAADRDLATSRDTDFKQLQDRLAELQHRDGQAQQRQAAFSIASKTEKDLAEQAAVEQRALSEASASLHTLRSELDALQATAQNGSVQDDAALKEMTGRLKQLSDALAAARTAQTGGIDAADATLDSALSQFQAEIDAAKNASSSVSGLSGYLTVAQQALGVIRQARADLVQHLGLSRQTLADLTRSLAEKKSATVQNDPEFIKLAQYLHVLEHRLGAAASSPLAEEVAQIRAQVREQEKAMEIRRQQIEASPVFSQAIGPIQKLIDDQTAQARAQQARVQQTIEEQFRLLAAATPGIDALAPGEQQAMARLDEKLSAVKTSRGQTSQIAIALTGADLKTLETQTADLQAQIDARRRELSAAARPADAVASDSTALKQKIVAVIDAQNAEGDAMARLKARNAALAAAQATLNSLQSEQADLVRDNIELGKLQTELEAMKNSQQHQAARALLPRDPQEDDAVQIIRGPNFRPAAISAIATMFTIATGWLIFRSRRQLETQPSRASTRGVRANRQSRVRARPAAAA